MNDIKITREKINSIDKEMASLFEERMLLAKDVAEYKKEHGLPILDADRENAVIEKNVSYLNDAEYSSYYHDFIKGVMDISKNYQYKLLKGMKVGYAGVPGAYAHIAARKAFPTAELVSYPSFQSAYDSVNKGECDVVVLPFENSYAGEVGTVMDLMFSGNLYVNDVIDLSIIHNLLVKKSVDLGKIDTVASHAQALSQCRDYIEKHGLKTIEYPNTAIAAKSISESKEDNVAVIASDDVAELYNLEVKAHSINDALTNTTRFAIMSKFRAPSKGTKANDHFIIMYTVPNKAGALASSLNLIGAHGFNMRTLKSRPMKELMWSYYFFVELDGNIDSSEAKDMISQLNSICDKVKVLGSYSSRVEK